MPLASTVHPRASACWLYGATWSQRRCCLSHGLGEIACKASDHRHWARKRWPRRIAPQGPVASVAAPRSRMGGPPLLTAPLPCSPAKNCGVGWRPKADDDVLVAALTLPTEVSRAKICLQAFAQPLTQSTHQRVGDPPGSAQISGPSKRFAKQFLSILHHQPKHRLSFFFFCLARLLCI